MLIGGSLPPFMIASCLTRPQTSDELKALETLRGVTRGGSLPPEDLVLRLESQFSRTKVAGLARIVRARIRLVANDFPGAADLLDASVIHQETSIGDYALLMRGDALEQAGKPSQARAAYDQLIRQYPSSLRRQEATLRSAESSLKAGDGPMVPAFLKELAEKDVATALLLTARAYEQFGEPARAIAAYRRIYFYAPASTEASEASSSLVRLGSSISPQNSEEAIARAERLYQARKYVDASQAYAVALRQFPSSTIAEMQLRSGIAYLNIRKTPEAISALGSVPVSAAEVRAEALFYLAQAYGRSRQWEEARSVLDEMRRNYSSSVFTPRALVSVGKIAEEAKNTADTSYFLRTAVNSYQGSPEVAQAQFDLAWTAHELKNYAESSRMLTEHLAFYANKNTDNRGRAAYWAARDSERSGKLAEARALYQALLVRYEANWYGYLAQQRLEALPRAGNAQKSFPPDSLVGQAVSNLQTVTVAEESSEPEQSIHLTKADQLTNTGLDDWALEELAKASEANPTSPRVNLATARVYRSREDNVQALNVLKKSYPDYSQMEPQELTREEWDVFYPLSYWSIIVGESRARKLDPFQVAGLIRQETIFNSRARSSANAYGLMQVLVPTARLTAKRYGFDTAITAERLFEPRLNIQLGTAYLRDQIDRFGRIEYVAAAYNAGPLRVVRWRESLPADIDEWVEAIPFRETRLYVQGVVRNRLQYERLYDKDGRFRLEVGTRAISAEGRELRPNPPFIEPVNSTVRRRKVTGSQEEE